VCTHVRREEDPVKGFYRRAGDTRAHFLAYGAAALKFEGEWRELGAPFTDSRCTRYRRRLQVWLPCAAAPSL